MQRRERQQLGVNDCWRTMVQDRVQQWCVRTGVALPMLANRVVDTHLHLTGQTILAGDILHYLQLDAACVVSQPTDCHHRLLLSILAALPDDVATTLMNDMLQPLGRFVQNPSQLRERSSTQKFVASLLDSSEANRCFVELLEAASAHELHELRQQLRGVATVVTKRLSAIECMLRVLQHKHA